MNTLEKRKERIIQWVREHNDGIDDSEKIINQHRNHKPIAENGSNLLKYVEPLYEKTNVDEILLSQNIDYEAFEKNCEEYRFFDHIPEHEFIRQIREMS